MVISLGHGSGRRRGYWSRGMAKVFGRADPGPRPDPPPLPFPNTHNVIFLGSFIDERRVETEFIDVTILEVYRWRRSRRVGMAGASFRTQSEHTGKRHEHAGNIKQHKWKSAGTCSQSATRRSDYGYTSEARAVDVWVGPPSLSEYTQCNLSGSFVDGVRIEAEFIDIPILGVYIWRLLRRAGRVGTDFRTRTEHAGNPRYTSGTQSNTNGSGREHMPQVPQIVQSPGHSSKTFG